MPWEQGCDLVGAFNLFRVEDFAGRILSALDNITSVKCYSLEVQEVMSDRFLILSDPDEGFEFSVSIDEPDPASEEPDAAPAEGASHGGGDDGCDWLSGRPARRRRSAPPGTREDRAPPIRRERVKDDEGIEAKIHETIDDVELTLEEAIGAIKKIK